MAHPVDEAGTNGMIGIAVKVVDRVPTQANEEAIVRGPKSKLLDEVNAIESAGVF
jgi:hypothetical protein